MQRTTRNQGSSSEVNIHSNTLQKDFKNLAANLNAESVAKFYNKYHLKIDKILRTSPQTPQSLQNKQEEILRKVVQEIFK